MQGCRANDDDDDDDDDMVISVKVRHYNSLGMYGEVWALD
jgi:hypothetical protein